MKFIKNNFQKIFIGVIIIIVLAVVLLRGDSLNELIRTMKDGAPIPLILAAIIQFGRYFFQSFSYSFAFRAVGERLRARDALPLVFGTFFMNTIAPSMNLAGTTLVVDDTRRRGIDPGKSTSASLLMQITIDGSFTTIMICSFILLLCTVGLNPLWIVMGFIVVCLVGGMILLLVLGKRRPQLLHIILGKIEKLLNKISLKIRKKEMKPWAERIVKNFSEASFNVSKNKKWVLAAYCTSLLSCSCELICFALCGYAFTIDVIEPLICGYVVATLFAMISITPCGIGVVEAMIVVAFTAYGQNAAAATATGLVYRGFVFWMPFIVGAILMTRLKAFKGSAKKTVDNVVDVRKEYEETGDIDFKKRISDAQEEFRKENEAKQKEENQETSSSS